MNIYFLGGEDLDFSFAGGAFFTTSSGGAWYRTAYARGALQANTAGTVNSTWIQNWTPFSASTFWFSARLTLSNGNGGSGGKILTFLDASFIERLRIVHTGTTNTWRVEKVDAAGSATVLGSNITSSVSTSTPSKIDVFVNDAVSGTFTVYIDGVQVFTFAGDTTTNSVTTLANFRLGMPSTSPFNAWSEVFVTDTDTRSMSLQTLAPVANGNTHNFDTGTPAAANVNETALNDATFDGSTTAGQIDQYTIPALAAGNLSILALAVNVRSLKGSSGPTKLDLSVRSGGNDFFSADKAQDTAYNLYQNIWQTDPNTSAAWAALPSNIGIKSVA